jgi:hypothetical protein
MSSQAEALLQLIGFFQVKGIGRAAASGRGTHAAARPVLPAPPAARVAHPAPILPHPVAQSKKKGAHAADGGYARFPGERP